MLQTQGLCQDPLAQCQALLATMPTAAGRQELRASLEVQLATAKPRGLDHVGLPISSDTIESLFGVAKHQGVGQPREAARLALRVPALCGAPTREEAEPVLGLSVARPHELLAQCTSLTQQRREVFGHPEPLESLGLSQGKPQVELIPSPTNRANPAAAINLSIGCGNRYGPQLVRPATPCVLENVGPPDVREAALT